MKEKRNINLDIIRTIAVISVLSVHFFLNNGFYSEVITGKRMFVMISMRTAFMVCVPLFMLLTGYLMNKKVLSKGYYLGLLKTYITYLLVSFLCIVFKKYYYGEAIGIGTCIKKILNFSGAEYSWYIEMYIGLYLLIPFLNLIYYGLRSKKQKQILIMTLIALTVLPTLVNIWGISDAFKSVIFPKETTCILEVLPNYWQFLWPFTYYYIGCYMKEYGFKLSSSKSIILFTGFLVVFSFFNFGRNYNNTFAWSSYYDWNGFETMILSVLLFVCVLNLNTSRIVENSIIYKCFKKISELSLGIYLVSSIFDTIIYDKLNSTISIVRERLDYFIIVVPSVFFLSFIASFMVCSIQKKMMFCVQKMYRKHLER